MIVKIILLWLAIVLSAPAADKIQYFVHLSFNSTLQLINVISSYHQEILKYFNSTWIAASFRIPFATYATVFSNNLELYLKNLEISSLTISALKLVASSFE